MQVDLREWCAHPMNVSFCRATMTTRISRQSRLLMSWPRSRICAHRPGSPLLSELVSRQDRFLVLYSCPAQEYCTLNRLVVRAAC